MSSDTIERAALLSSDGRYRYSLTRNWDRALQVVGWLMLNPSTADGEIDDRTIRKCCAFARSWGYGGIVVRNLFAYRATDPKQLAVVDDPVGPENDAFLHELGGPWMLVVAAWGVGGELHGRGDQVRQMLAAAGTRLHHVGLTKDGHPRHPLYLRGDTTPTPWTHPLPDTPRLAPSAGGAR